MVEKIESCFLKPRVTNASICPQHKDIQFTVIDEEIFTFRKLKLELFPLKGDIRLSK